MAFGELINMKFKYKIKTTLKIQANVLEEKISMDTSSLLKMNLVTEGNLSMTSIPE
jgi:hypothetical protein